MSGKGYEVLHSATVICLRPAKNQKSPSTSSSSSSPSSLSSHSPTRSKTLEDRVGRGISIITAQEAGLRPKDTDDFSMGIQMMFSNTSNGVLEFSSGWEVLMGQSECVNWLRSTPTEQVVMRYPGEYKFPGGTIDEGEEIEEAARRELSEEFLIDVPKNAKLRLFNLRQTKPIKGRSFIMHNYIAFTSENPWLEKEEYQVEKLNARLAERRVQFDRLTASGEFWKLSQQEKEHLAPEVRELRWLSIRDAVYIMMPNAASDPVFINKFQLDEFTRLGVQRRDPMFQTMFTLMEVEERSRAKSEKNGKDRSPEECLIKHCEGLPPVEEMRITTGQAFNKHIVRWMQDLEKQVDQGQQKEDTKQGDQEIKHRSPKRKL